MNGIYHTNLLNEKVTDPVAATVSDINALKQNPSPTPARTAMMLFLKPPFVKTLSDFLSAISIYTSVNEIMSRYDTKYVPRVANS